LTIECSVWNVRTKDRSSKASPRQLRLKVNDMEEGRKRVLGIMASILVARHLKTTEDLHDSRPSPRTESLVGSAVQWAERIMRRIDGTFANSADDRRWPRA
jgi:hypothetical protein